MINGIVATGSDLTTAFPLPAQGDVLAFDVQTTPTGSGILLPQAIQCRSVIFIRNSGANALLVYPASTGTINSSMSPFSVAAGDVLEMWALSALDWVQMEGGGGPAPPAYLAPAFTSFGISGQATTLEVGDSVTAASHTFTWSTSNSGNVATNSISIVDTTASVTLASGLANSGSHAITLSAITHTAPATQRWTVAGVDTQSTVFSREFDVDWEWRAHWGQSANATLTGAQILALASSALQTASAGTYPEGATGFKYFCVPTTFTQPVLFKDSVTQFNIPQASASDNAAYSNVNPSGISYAIVNVTNGLGVAQDYAVYRSKNASASAVTMIVL